MRRFAFAAALAAAPLAAASAGIPVSQTMTCPIGGGSFEFTTTASYSTYGTRPDGKPFGSWEFPLALPECPDNGLVLYKEYTPEEVARLEPLVASEAYQALRKDDTQYYRAYWLMKEMGLSPADYLWALLQASWEADGKPELRARYQTELVDASAAVEAKPDDLNWIGMEARAVNAQRELGRFDEAIARLDKMPLASLDVRVPLGEAGDAAVQEARKRRAWMTFLKALRTAIERKDPAVEPQDLLPRDMAIGRCIDGVDKLSEHGRAFCESQSASVEEMRASRDKLKRETEALKQTREASGR